MTERVVPESVATASRRENAMVVFAMTGAAGVAGGIAASNLNVLRALLALSVDSGRSLTVLSLHEDASARPCFLRGEDTFIGFQGNKGAYTAKLISLFRRDRIFIFDHVRLGLPLIPVVACGYRNFVILAHGSESWRRVRRMSKWLFRRARLCLTNSRFTLERMRGTFSGFEGKSCALGLPPSHESLGEDPESTVAEISFEAVDGLARTLGSRVVLLVGRMDQDEREKGHRELLSVWPDVLRTCPEAQLVFAGPGNDRGALARMAEKLQIASTVFMPGYLPIDVLGGLYRRCYAFVMPSRQEGFGLVYLEAMNFAKPCVACRNGGGEEVIENEISGLLIDNPYQNEELLDAVRRLLVDEELARRLGNAGRQRLNDNFTSTHAQTRLSRLLAPIMLCD